MSKNTSIILNGQLDVFVEQQVDSGNYASVSEVIRAGLRLLEEREMQVQRLRAEIQKGLDSGVVDNFDINDFLEQRHAVAAAANG